MRPRADAGHGVLVPQTMAIRSMRLALYQPEIALNVGAILRLGACLGVPVDIIEPCGFPFDRRAVRRSAMDYYDHVALTRHRSWDAFIASHEAQREARLVLLTTRGERSYQSFAFTEGDTLLAGSESAGVSDAVRQAADARVRVPMVAGVRSLNVAVACAMVLGEALRQTGNLPEHDA